VRRERTRQRPAPSDRLRRGRRRQFSPVARSPSLLGRAERDSSQQSRPPTVEAGPSPFRRARAAPAHASRQEQHGHGRAALVVRPARRGGDRTRTPTTPRRALFRAVGRRTQRVRCTVGGCRCSRSCCRRHSAGCQPARAQDRESPRYLRRQRRGACIGDSQLEHPATPVAVRYGVDGADDDCMCPSGCSISIVISRPAETVGMRDVNGIVASCNPRCRVRVARMGRVAMSALRTTATAGSSPERA
jgi:hypothetical protein